MKSLYLIRHGQTQALTGVEQADPRNDSSLSALGREQVQRVAAHLQGRQVDLILTSVYRRSLESAGILNQGRGAPQFAASALNEFLLRDDRSGAERLEQGVARSMGFLYQFSPYFDHLAVVAHRSILCAVLITICNLQFSCRKDAFRKPGTCCLLRCESDRGDENWREVDLFVP
jgi:broad specificity phosphatase PhoE